MNKQGNRSAGRELAQLHMEGELLPKDYKIAIEWLTKAVRIHFCALFYFILFYFILFYFILFYFIALYFIVFMGEFLQFDHIYTNYVGVIWKYKKGDDVKVANSTVFENLHAQAARVCNMYHLDFL